MKNNKTKEITLGIDVRHLSITDALNLRNMIEQKIVDKLQADNNGEFWGAGYMEGICDIALTEIKDVKKAESCIAEVFDELKLPRILISINNYVIDEDIND